MKQSTLKYFEEFKGKICTIITKPINRSFTEEQLKNHFVSLIQEINEDGILGIHPFDNTLNFYNFNSIISIHEELVLDPNNPEDAEKIKELEKGKNESDNDIKPLSLRFDEITQEREEETEAAFIDVNSLSKLAKKSKATYDLISNKNA